MWLDVDIEGLEMVQDKAETKYQLIHNFASVNCITKLRPFPMGDLPAIQQEVMGHCWISVMNLLAGFNVVPVAPVSIPYMGFHINRCGYYIYL